MLQKKPADEGPDGGDGNKKLNPVFVDPVAVDVIGVELDLRSLVLDEEDPSNALMQKVDDIIAGEKRRRLQLLTILDIFRQLLLAKESTAALDLIEFLSTSAVGTMELACHQDLWTQSLASLSHKHANTLSGRARKILDPCWFPDAPLDLMSHGNASAACDVPKPVDTADAGDDTPDGSHYSPLSIAFTVPDRGAEQSDSSKSPRFGRSLTPRRLDVTSERIASTRHVSERSASPRLVSQSEGSTTPRSASSRPSDNSGRVDAGSCSKARHRLMRRDRVGQVGTPVLDLAEPVVDFLEDGNSRVNTRVLPPGFFDSQQAVCDSVTVQRS